MRFSLTIAACVVSTAMLAGCATQTQGAGGLPSAASSSNRIDFKHPLVAPGLAGRRAIMPGVARPTVHRVHHDFAAVRPCTELSDNISGDVAIFNKNGSLAGTFGTNAYGWGVYANSVGTYYGRNDGSGSLDVYVNCTNHPGGTLTGLGTGYNPYGIGGRRASQTVYAVLWPENVIEYWPNGGAVQSGTDPNMGLAYFVDVDAVGNVWLTGYNIYGNAENLDECNADLSVCSTKASIPYGFPGGVQVDSNEQVYVNNQYGTIYSYDCSGASACYLTGQFTYSNGSNPLDYTALALDQVKKHRIWGANIFTGGCSGSIGVCTNGQPQSLPLNSSVLGTPTATWPNTESLGIARFPADRP